MKYRENEEMKQKMAADQVIIEKKMEQHYSKYKAEREARLMRGRYRKERNYFREKESVVDTHPFFAFVLKGLFTCETIIYCDSRYLLTFSIRVTYKQT